MPTVRRIDSGFHRSHDTYNGIGAASDGCVYYVLCAESFTEGARMFRYEPISRRVSAVADLTEACGETGAVPQGKSHVNFYEYSGKLYFGTHVGIYSNADGKEGMPAPPPGLAAYPGGHFLSYDLSTGATEDLGLAPGGEGILTMAVDGPRGRAYAITWPRGHLVTLDLGARRVSDLGPVSALGEAGVGNTYRTLCRSLQVDPFDGSVYFTVSEGWICRLRFGDSRWTAVEGDDLRKDYFGQYDVSSPGHMAYNWRQTFWYEPEGVIYGVHGNSGYLFRFDPRNERVEVLDRIASLPSRRSGMFDQFSYGYLGFGLGPGDTIYYLTGGPIYENGRRIRGKAQTARGEAKGEENLHLILYNLRHGTYEDRGPLFFEDGLRPSYVNSIAITAEERVYSISRVRPEGSAHSDLMVIEG
jgi:hypothetical protein